MMIKKLSFLAVIGFLFSGAVVVAATPAVEPPQISLSFGVSSRDSIDGLVYRPVKSQNFKPVVFYSGNRPAPLSYKGPEKMEFFEAATASTEGARPVAVCAVPTGLKRALLLFFPKVQASADGLKYDVVAVDDSIEKVAPNSFAVINISNQEYIGSYGAAAPISIGKGISESFPASGGVNLQLAVRSGDNWRKSARRNFDLESGARVWVIIYPPAGVNDVHPVIQTLAEELPPQRLQKNTVIARYP